MKKLHIFAFLLWKQTTNAVDYAKKNMFDQRFYILQDITVNNCFLRYTVNGNEREVCAGRNAQSLNVHYTEYMGFL